MMKLIVSTLFFVCIVINITNAQSVKFDTTMKMGKVGYRTTCSNKSEEKNMINISPIGFDSKARPFAFEVKGRVKKAEIDDLNWDGFPDMVIYVYTTDSLSKGSVVGISSEKNESVAPIIFPDILDDPKLRNGYKGGDVFSLMEGMLVRKFPLFSDAAPTEPANKTRRVQYRVMVGERGMLKFHPFSTYDF